MKGYIPVEIPTKKYIKAYLVNELGESLIMNTEHKFGSKLYDVLSHTTNEDKKDFSNKRYNCIMRIRISMHVFKKRGCFLNEHNIKHFNLFVENDLKDKFHFLMDTYIDALPSFENNLPEVRRRLGIDIEDWSDDSMKKQYYRYRKYSGKELLYKKSFSVTVPSDKSANLTF